jgi:peptide deformylase
MAVREILQLGDPLLHLECRAVDGRDVSALVRDLSETLAAFRARHGYGRGIAAPQIGVWQRVIFIHMPDGFHGALINPRIERASDERFELWDDCFSFPDLMVRVSRAREVRVAYLDEQGTPQAIDARDDFSELLQHEIDHLDGILATQRAVSPLSFATRAEWERRQGRITAEIKLGP